MLPLYAYAISGAVIASIATWAFLQFPGLLIWCAFIGWAGFLHSGGGRVELKTAPSCMVFGVLMAWLFSMLLASGHFDLPIPIVAAILVAIVAPFIILVSKFSLLSIVPASFYGFASAFAYLAQTSGRFTMAAMTSLTLDNVIFIVPISMLIGVGLGYLQTVMSSMLMAKRSVVVE